MSRCLWVSVQGGLAGSSGSVFLTRWKSGQPGSWSHLTAQLGEGPPPSSSCLWAEFTSLWAVARGLLGSLPCGPLQAAHRWQLPSAVPPDLRSDILPLCLLCLLEASHSAQPTLRTGLGDGVAAIWGSRDLSHHAPPQPSCLLGWLRQHFVTC